MKCASCIVAIAVLCCGIDRAHASCAVALEGDPAVVERIRAELADFADDSAACLTLWVQARKASDQLEIDLHDELGQSSLRLFASPGGAAAFIISWSRRPLSLHITAIEPGARPLAPPGAAVASAAVSAEVSQDQPWHLEFDTGAIVASGNHPYWAATDVSLVRREWIFRYGGELRMMMGWYLGNVVGEATARFGVVRALSDRLTASADLTAGGTINGVKTDYGADFGAAGFRAGVRTAFHVRLAASLGLEIGGGVDGLQQLDIPGAGPAAYVHYLFCPYGNVGVRWVP